MQYQIPQFIEVEDQIFGSLTFKQFIYVLGGAGITYSIFRLIPITFIAIIVAAPFAILAFSLAFRDFNGRPFISLVESYLKFFTRPRVYVWRKRVIEPKKDVVEQNINPLEVKELDKDRLRTLSWSLDVNEKF